MNNRVRHTGPIHKQVLGYSVIWDGHFYTVVSAGSEERFSTYSALENYLRAKKQLKGNRCGSGR